jgi:hypothetical protein
MPQIDIASYVSILLWSGLFISLGYVLFYLYGLLPLANMMKLPTQWAGFQQNSYWVDWNHEEIADLAPWLDSVATATKTAVQHAE